VTRHDIPAQVALAVLAEIAQTVAGIAVRTGLDRPTVET
jgi:hypothetical protein